MRIAQSDHFRLHRSEEEKFNSNFRFGENPYNLFNVSSNDVLTMSAGDLFVTYCSGEKVSSNQPYGPGNLYVSDRISRFVDYCSIRGYDWAILSAKYGLFFPYERRRRYDVRMWSREGYWLNIGVVVDGSLLPPSRSEKHLRHLIRKVSDQITSNDIGSILLYGPSPKMMRCYLVVLHSALDGCFNLHDWKELLGHVDGSVRLAVSHRLVF